MLIALRVKPSQVFLLEQTEDECVRRLSNRKIDPQTGIVYNLEINPPGDEATSNRLINSAEDSEAVVKARYQTWKEQVSMLEDYFKGVMQVVQADRPMDQLTEVLADAIQNPM